MDVSCRKDFVEKNASCDLFQMLFLGIKVVFLFIVELIAVFIFSLFCYSFSRGEIDISIH